MENSNVNINEVGSGKVVLLAGGGKCFTDIAARFVGSKKNLDDIIASDYNAKLVRNILNSGHLACTEFDNFVFGIEGYSRVTEVQLVRKRHASYIISSGRGEMDGKRQFDVSIPKNIRNIKLDAYIDPDKVSINGISANRLYSQSFINVKLDTDDIIELLNQFYNTGVQQGVPEEDLRYLKPQATTFKAIVSMNAHALIDWFKIRCCMKAQTEIRDLANKMLKLCKEVSPDLFSNAGPSCVSLGYCPENRLQHVNCKGKIPTHKEVKDMLQYENKLIIDFKPVQSKTWDLDMSLEDLTSKTNKCLINRNFESSETNYENIMDGKCLYVTNPNSEKDNFVIVAMDRYGFTTIGEIDKNDAKGFEVDINKGIKELIISQCNNLSEYIIY